MTDKHSTSTPVPYGWIMGLSSWVLLTIVTNYADRQFDGVRERYRGPSVAVPEWRFFAPDPPTGDTVILWRYLKTDGLQSNWERLMNYPQRRWTDGIFFLKRREMKELFDVANQLSMVKVVSPWALERTPHYAMLKALVIAAAQRHRDADRISGVQFMLATESGEFTSTPHEVEFTSGFESLVSKQDQLNRRQS